MNDDPAESVLDVLDAIAAHWEAANYQLIDELIMADDDWQAEP